MNPTPTPTLFIVSRRRIDPTNDARRANIIRQHGLSMRDHPVEAPRELPFNVREIAQVFSIAGAFVLAVFAAMAVLP